MHADRQRPGPTEIACWIAVATTCLWSTIDPHDRLTWWLEALPSVAVLVLLPALFARFRFTPLATVLIAAHAIVLLVGAHYTYAEVPLGNWARDTFDLSRNHYDRFGHVMQGFTPAIVAREVLARRSPLHGSRWLPFLAICFCLAFSAFYELIEWWVAVSTGDDAVAFLATQGDVWDTQWDMFLALAGACLSIALFTRLHDRQLAQLAPRGA